MAKANNGNRQRQSQGSEQMPHMYEYFEDSIDIRHHGCRTGLAAFCMLAASPLVHAAGFSYDLSYDTGSRVVEVAIDANNSGTYSYRDNGQLSTIFLAGNGSPPPADADLDGLPDNEDPDDDNDGLPDQVEIAAGLNPFYAGDADDDSDGDGVDNLAEYQLDTDLAQPDIRLLLNRGTNLISLPIDPIPPLDSRQLAADLGPAVVTISRYNTVTGQMEITRVVDGVVGGDSFPITSAQGYMVEMATAGEQRLSGDLPDRELDLLAGTNLAGLATVPSGMTAHDLLQQLGGADVIAGISHLEPRTGRYQTVFFQHGQPAGTDFPILRGESYIFTMYQRRAGIGSR